LKQASIETAIRTLGEKNLIQENGLLNGWGESKALSTARVRAHRKRKRAAHATPPPLKGVDPDLASRRRLQKQMLDRHARRGRTLADE
jgi:hypothetical protein